MHLSAASASLAFTSLGAESEEGPVTGAQPAELRAFEAGAFAAAADSATAGPKLRLFTVAEGLDSDDPDVGELCTTFAALEGGVEAALMFLYSRLSSVSDQRCSCIG